MVLLFVLALCIVAVAVIFAVQNAAPVAVVFMSWQFSAALALLLLGAFAAGLAVGLLAVLPSQIKRRLLISRQGKVIRELEENLKEYKNLLNPAEPLQ